MSSQRECPMCGEPMRQTQRQQVDHLPGAPERRTRELREWVCPGCDYFEEVEAE